MEGFPAGKPSFSLTKRALFHKIKKFFNRLCGIQIVIHLIHRKRSPFPIKGKAFNAHT